MKRLGPSGWQAAAATVVVAATAALLFGACEAAKPEKDVAPPPPPAATIEKPAEPAVVPIVSFNALMVTTVDNAGHVLWDAEKKGFSPRNAADWLEIEDHALQLAAVSTLLQVGGAGAADQGWVKQVGWKDHAKAMGTAALAAHQAAKDRNKDNLIKANSGLVEACEGCHKAFKPELPSEGLAHQRPHSESHKTNR